MTKSNSYAVVGLGFGDEGKAHIVDYLTRKHEARLVVRFNGGPNRKGTVVEASGREHIFSQFGSGTLAGADTYLSRYMLVEPYSLLNEADALSRIGIANPLLRIMVDWRCPIITPYHWLSNRIRERARGNGKHGTVGWGIGELRGDLEAGSRDQLVVADLSHLGETQVRLGRIRDRKIEELKQFSDFPEYQRMLKEDYFPRNVAEFYFEFYRRVNITRRTILAAASEHDVIIFEGSQGVLLDEKHGFAPHNSWTNCTFENAEALCKESGRELTKVGVLRSYSTRHGAGPFPAGGTGPSFPEPHNGEDAWQGAFRQGAFDAVMARYALRVVGGVDQMAINHIDCVTERFPIIPAYRSRDGEYLSNLVGTPSATDIELCDPVATTSAWTPMGAIQHEIGVSVRGDWYFGIGPTADMVLDQEKGVACS